FCWPDPVVSEKTPDGRYKLAQLVRANRAIDDVCRAYRLPCISGKDSMKNDVTMHGEKISVPPTILFSLIGNHNDVRKAVSSDFKQAGDHIYLLGETHQELGASEIAYMFRDECSGGIGGRVPGIDAERNLALYKALTDAMSQGLVASAHDCSDGGFSVALAECCFGSGTGAAVDITELGSNDPELDSFGALFSESLGRILVSVRPSHSEAFAASMEGHMFHRLGTVEEGDDLSVTGDGSVILKASISDLKHSWQSSLGGSSQ
ncbi:MAG: AIR synthase-related protein, partial [Candidatus Thermoplasmatota archaeon]|nr:AIR synthase-related protein [Candidatus Thermoplasmatota archaeon]